MCCDHGASLPSHFRGLALGLSFQELPTLEHIFAACDICCESLFPPRRRLCHGWRAQRDAASGISEGTLPTAPRTRSLSPGYEAGFSLTSTLYHPLKTFTAASASPVPSSFLVDLVPTWINKYPGLAFSGPCPMSLWHPVTPVSPSALYALTRSPTSAV